MRGGPNYEVANSVVRALEIQLAPQEEKSLSSSHTSQPAAYDFYLQGKGYLQDFLKPENLESAITVFNHALELDGQYALAYASLGEAYWYRFEATREQNPNSAYAHLFYGFCYLLPMGRVQDAITENKNALELDPLSLAINNFMAMTYYYTMPGTTTRHIDKFSTR